jgi:exodeoxyribonuclease VII large subunit
VLRSDDILRDVWVRGEVSGCKTVNGHCYFTLKDAEARLACVFFKYARMRASAPDLRDGMAIVANGRVSFYERDGKLQLYVERIEALGDGALYLRFEQLKQQLEAEGLFDVERKRSLPEQPSVIGIVTSPQAAALRDMLLVLRTRYPLARVILSPTLVQGVDAPSAIARALDLLNEHGEAEELWAFNEEVVARAIARSRIPVISAVGHETDFTIADFVADYRASTPTAAASAAVPDIAEWQARIQAYEEDLSMLIEDYLSEKRDDLARSVRDLQRLNPQFQLDRLRQRLDDATELMQSRMEHILTLHRERLRGLAMQLHALSPLLTVGRGYAVVRRDEDQRLVTSVQHVQPGDDLTIQVTDGYIQAKVL